MSRRGLKKDTEDHQRSKRSERRVAIPNWLFHFNHLMCVSSRCYYDEETSASDEILSALYNELMVSL